MKTQTCKPTIPFTVIVLVIVTLLTSACGVHFHDLGTINQVVDIRIDQAMISQSKPSIEVHGHDFWEDLDCDVQSAELHDGYIRFLGTSSREDAYGRDCSIDVSLSVEDGMLVSRIVAMDVPRFRMEDPIVVSLNQELETQLHFTDFDMTTVVRFQEVEVTEQALRLKVKVSIDF